MSDDHSWAPRAVQEARLQNLEHRLASKNVTIDTKIEHAVLLSALDRRAEAQQAFIEILLGSPTHFSALNEFGNFLVSVGSIAAACRVYLEAITHYPKNPIGHVNLANLLLRGGDLERARSHYEAAIGLNSDHPQAHQGLGAVLSGIGDHSSAKSHFQKGFRNHFISTLPYRGTRPPVSVLLLVSSGSGNIPTASFLDDRLFITSVVVADFLNPSVPLPDHQLVFNSIGDADLCSPALEAAIRLMKRTSAPVINDPSAVSKTGRVANARRLRALQGVRTPQMLAMPRSVLAGRDGVVIVSGHGFSFPLLLRSPGFHTGQNFVFVKSATELAKAASSLPGDALLVIEYLDARSNDGNARKYRVMIIDGRIYPMHLAISRHWKVHYFTSDMSDHADYRSEEAAFLSDMPKIIGKKAVRALEKIGNELGLDYGGIDFGLGPTGDVLLFEANATMVVNPADPNEEWAYRRPAVAKVFDAVSTMILERAAGTFKYNVA